MRKLALILIFSSSAISLTAQKNYLDGFIVNLNGDTVRGLINEQDFALNFVECRFKGEKGVEIKYRPGEIRGYGIGRHSYYISQDIIQVEKDLPTKFIEVLILGKLSLYQYKEHFIFQKDTLPFTVLVGAPKMKEQNGVYTNVKSNLTHIGILAYLFQECSEIEIVANKTSVNRDKLMKLTKQYNTCLDADYVVYKIKKPLVRISPVLYGNLGSTKMAYDESINKNGDHFLREVTPEKRSLTQFGVGIGFILPRISDRFLVDLALNFSSFDYSNIYSSDIYLGNNITGEAINDVAFNGALIKIPLVFQYSLFARNIISPYVRAGVVYRSVSYDNTTRKRNIVYQSYDSEDFYDFQINSSLPGFTIAGGLEMKLGKHLGIFGQVQLDKFPGTGAFDRITENEEPKSPHLEFKMTRTDALLGFGMRFY